MKKTILLGAGMLAAGVAAAENLEGVDEMICASTQVQICLDGDECYAVTPWELDIPEFIVIDTKNKTISTTKASGQNRATKLNTVKRIDDVLYLQGIEGGRAYSFVIEETTGRMTVAVSRAGLTVTVFGTCTDTDI